MADPPLLIARIASLPFRRLEALHVGEAAATLHEACAWAERVDASAAALESSLFAAAGPPEAEPRLGPEESAVAALPARLLLLQARRAVHGRRRAAIAAAARELAAIDPATSATLARFTELLDQRAASIERFRAEHERAIAHGAERLLAASREPLLEEGLRLVSRSLLGKTSKLGAFDRWKHRERHTALKLVGYLTRAATKTSPNGVFCATALAAFGTHARCRGDHSIVTRDALLAVGEARKISACLAVDPELALLVRPRPNPTLREQDGRWTFWRPASPRDATDDEVLSSAGVHPVARAVLDACAPDRDFAALVAEVAGRAGLAVADLERFAQTMIERGLLIAEVEIPWSERRPLRHLADAACRAGCASSWCRELETLEDAVDRLGPTPWPERGALLDRISEHAERLPHRRPLQHDELIRVDAASRFDLVLPRGAIEELERFVGWYARLYGTLYPRQRFIEGYARRFLATFPADTDVPLLDLYHGPFEPRGEARPATFPPPSGPGAQADQARRAFALLRDRLVMEARLAGREGRDEVDLQAIDTRAIFGDAPPPAWSCGVLFQVAANDPEAIDAGRYRLAVNGLYAGGGLAVARLAHLHAEGGPVEASPIAREVKKSWSALERDGAVIAEVSYMHGGRTANAGLRPSLFGYEIELPGDCATPGREVIPLRELTVRFESGARRFRLRWSTRGVDVLPIVASGISPEGLVSFLLAIGQQELQPLALFAGLDVEGVTRWPRFRFGRVVVFRRRWSFAAAELPPMGSLPFLDHRRLLEVARWRRRHGLPRHVFARAQADPKPFYVDLESPWMIESLSHRLAGSPMATLDLSEMLPGPDEMWAHDEAGRYATEFLVHLKHRPDPASEGAMA